MQHPRPQQTPTPPHIGHPMSTNQLGSLPINPIPMHSQQVSVPTNQDALTGVNWGGYPMQHGSVSTPTYNSHSQSGPPHQAQDFHMSSNMFPFYQPNNTSPVAYDPYSQSHQDVSMGQPPHNEAFRNHPNTDPFSV